MVNLAQRIGQEFKSLRDTEITNLQNADTTLQTNIDSEATARAAADTTLQTNINNEATARSSADTTLQQNIDAEATARASADTTLQNLINTEKGRIDAILAASTADKDTFAEIVSFINSVDTTNDTALGTEITNRANADATLQTNIDNEATARANADAAISSDLTAKIGDATVDGTAGNTINDRIATSLSSAQSYADQAEVDAVATAQAYTNTRETAITSAYQAYADQAEVDAKSYTDAREAAITSAYQSYADQAEADAETAALNDLTNKIGDVTVNGTAGNTITDRINTAEADAISSAQAYTDGRETAITTAYQAYADQAEVDAKAYTDTRETAITTAYRSYADQAEADAKAYTDTRETAITTAYQTYANAAEADAVTTANAYTDTRETAITTAYRSYADQAEVDAKAYTDTRETAITAAYQAYADQAEADAETAAATYTNSQISSNVTNKLGVANGIATLDGSGLVPASQLPSFVDDVLEYANFAGFPGTGETGKLYVALDTNDVYRWTGSVYVKVSDAVTSADQATKLATARTISLSGDVVGSTTFDGTANVSITAVIADDSHNHVISNVDGLQAALDAKADDATTFTAGAGLTGGGTLGADRTFNVGAGSYINVAADTVSVDATSANTASKVVARDASGNFSAGTITAALSGNASTATTLQTARTINGVSFNGSSNIVVESYVENDDTTNATRYLTFVDNTTASYKRLNEDTNLTYNPATNTLTAGTFSGSLSGNASTASKLATARSIAIAGDATGSASFDGSANISISVSLAANTVTSSELSNAQSLVIYNSAGTALKTLYGAGS